MRIVYFARHDQTNSNDDEGAIHFAMESLGHEVIRLRESRPRALRRQDGDLLLVHHLHDLAVLDGIKMPKVFWCFDLIDWPNGGARHRQRCEWMRALTAKCDLGFCTDGDWVERDTTGKLHWLMQGADNRDVELRDMPKETDVLFVGGLGYGRDAFAQALQGEFGAGFKHILKGCHGQALADEVAKSKVVVAPPTPVTNKYWSNRVYNMLRVGACLVHPYAFNLACQYDFEGMKSYTDQWDMIDKIKRLLINEQARNEIATIGLDKTMQEHTYRHRCSKLVATVKERLGV